MDKGGQEQFWTEFDTRFKKLHTTKQFCKYESETI